MTKILVTGGAGFIGLHLCERLLERGHDVICLDDMSTSRSFDELNNLRKNPKFTFVEHDVEYAFDIPCNQLYHLACPASPVHYQNDPLKTIQTAFQGTYWALKNASRYCSKLLIASTSEVYGDPDQSPQHEGYLGRVNTTGIRSCYDEGKRAAESLAFSWIQVNKFDSERIRIARIFNTYGPRMALDDGRLIPNFMKQALRNTPITVYGDVSQTRSFCHVNDTVRGLQNLMSYSGPVKLPIVNIGNPDERTILSMAKMIIEVTGSSSDIIFDSLPQDDPKQRKPDISRAKEMLGWEPFVNLDDGIRMTADWYRQVISCE